MNFCASFSNWASGTIYNITCTMCLGLSPDLEDQPLVSHKSHITKSTFARFCGSRISSNIMSFSEYYLDYFKTPFFIFVRDSLSYLSLLGLHFAICLSPSTVSFSSLEWAIFLFFLGRIAMEVDQFVNAKKAERKQTKRTSARESSYEDGSDSHRSRDAPTNGNVVLRKFSNYFR